MANFPFDPEELANEIGVPLELWPGNCHGIASAVLHFLPVEGMRLARGHWLGEVSSQSVYHAAPVQHTWLMTADGRILDPTRWAIVSPRRPEIYLGPCDDYDEGGRILAARVPPPFPGSRDPYLSAVEALSLDQKEELANALRIAWPGSDSRIADELAFAVRADPSKVSNPASLYRFVDRIGRKAMIPIDSWLRVMEPEKLQREPGANRTFSLPPPTRLNDLELLSAIFNRFLSIECRPQIEEELSELGYALDADLWRCLNALETMKGDWQVNHLPREICDTLAVIAGDLLGKGYGEELRVERFAASLGADTLRLDAALRAFGERAGYDLRWNLGPQEGHERSDGFQP